MNKTFGIFCLLTFSLGVHAEGFGPEFVPAKSKWSSSNNPSIILGSKYESRFDALPLAGSASDAKIIWSDDYWARYQGGIAYRWRTDTSAEDYSVLNERKVSKLDQNEIDHLSPAEKFDLLVGDYNFSLTRTVRRQNPSSAPGWQGICHGWSPAAIHHPPGKLQTVNNNRGLSITFGSSDIHALLSYYYAKVDNGNVRILAKRCDSDGGMKCKDMNAGAFHLVMTNMLAIRQKAFVMDISYKQVWNQPVASFVSTVHDKQRPPSEGAATGTVREILITSSVRYVKENNSQWETMPDVLTGVAEYTYWLELDAENKIIGGSFESGYQPDFLWTRPKANFTDEWSVLNQLTE
jgi:hypothetical protein